MAIKHNMSLDELMIRLRCLLNRDLFIKTKARLRLPAINERFELGD
jgi:hypothetical protein